MAQPNVQYRVERSAFNQADFDEVYKYDKPGTSLRNLIRKVLPTCNRRQVINTAFEFLPVIKWVKEYQKSFLVPDIIGGLTVAILNVPKRWPTRV
ncbi:hypothetical protein L596_020057 [Steinernema carpocapsae]|uniref:Uncharacterized protein n=1 Tax=Steinernema carpocapsae TaxID=34508 RepID=A0A4U5MSG8_STECR|nr:hypothetical protein L596_020057 [Steinernema carpocapsae]